MEDTSPVCQCPCDESNLCKKFSKLSGPCKCLPQSIYENAFLKCLLWLMVKGAGRAWQLCPACVSIFVLQQLFTESKKRCSVCVSIFCLLTLPCMLPTLALAFNFVADPLNTGWNSLHYILNLINRKGITQILSIHLEEQCSLPQRMAILSCHIQLGFILLEYNEKRLPYHYLVELNGIFRIINGRWMKKMKVFFQAKERKLSPWD